MNEIHQRCFTEINLKLIRYLELGKFPRFIVNTSKYFKKFNFEEIKEIFLEVSQGRSDKIYSRIILCFSSTLKNIFKGL